MIFQSTFRCVFFNDFWASHWRWISFSVGQDKPMFVNMWFFWNGNLILPHPCLEFFWLYPFLGFHPLGWSSNAGAFLALKTFMISYIPFSFLPPVSSRPTDLTYFKGLPSELVTLALFLLPEIPFFAVLMANSSILSLDYLLSWKLLTPSQILLLWPSSMYSHKT